MFGEMLKVAIALKSRISERVGLCLEDEDPPGAWPSGQALSAGECPDGPASEPRDRSAPCCPPPSLLGGAGPDELPMLEVGQCLWDTGVPVLRWPGPGSLLAAHAVYAGLFTSLLICSTSA